MTRRWFASRSSSILLAVGLSVAAAGTAAGQTYTETEDNNNIGQANPIPPGAGPGMQPGETIGGLTTGTSTTASGSQSSADYFNVRIGTAPLAIYKQRLTFTSAGTASYSLSVRGYGQANGVIDTAEDASVTISSSTVLPRYLQWYGFGKGEQVMARVTGTTTTNQNYLATLSREAVTPAVATTVFSAGPITISTFAQTYSTNTEFYVYDSNLNPVPGFNNDDNTVAGGGSGSGNKSIATRDLLPGTYYVAISTFNLANNLASPSDERSDDSNVWSSPGAISTSATAVNQNVAFTVSDGTQTETVPGTKVDALDVVWAQFTVGAATNILVDANLAPSTVAPGTSTTLTLSVTPAPTPPNTITTVVADLSSIGGPSSAALTNNGGGNYSISYLVPAATAPGTTTIGYSVSDNGSRTVTGTLPITITPVVPPNDTCSTSVILTDGTLPYAATVGINLATADNAIGCSTALQTNNGIWYQYTPTTNCILKMRETGPRDVSIVVYAGACGSTELYCESTELDANFPMLANNTYTILITTPGSASTGTNDVYNVSFECGTAPAAPANDTCINAIPIVPGPGMQTFPAGGAGPDDFTSCITSNVVGESRNGIWFTYSTGPTDQLARLHRFNDSQFFSVSFYEVCGGFEYQCVNLGTPTGNNAVPLHRNTTYRLLVHRRSGWMAADGAYQFVFDIDPVIGQVPNADCAGAINVASVPFSDTKNNIMAFDDGPVPCVPGQAIAAHDGVWYKYTPAVDSQVTFRENSSQDAFVVIYEASDGTCNTISLFQCDSISEFADIDTIANLQGGRTYYFLVGRQATTDPTVSDVLTFEVSSSLALPPAPANDICDNAIVISTLPFSNTQSNANANNDLETSCTAGTITASSRHGIWYTYTSGPAAGQVAVMSETGPEDVVFAVLTGGCNSLVETTCLDAGSPETETSFPLTPNTTYHILVARRSDTFAAPSDQISFNFNVSVPPAPPSNDDCGTAKPITRFPFTDAPLMYSANTDQDVSCSGTTVNQTTTGVWYTFTAAGNYTLNFTETNSGLDVQWGIFTGGCGGLNEVFCNTTDTNRTFAVTGGTTYHVLVGRAATNPAFLNSQYQLTFTAAAGTTGACCNGTVCTSTTIEACGTGFVAGAVCDSGNPVACCPANFNAIGGVTVQDIFDFLAAYFSASPTADFNGNGSVTVQDIFDFLAGYFNGCT